MNQDAIINRICHVTGKSRKEVIRTLKEMSANEMVQKELKKNKRH